MHTHNSQSEILDGRRVFKTKAQMPLLMARGRQSMPKHEKTTNIPFQNWSIQLQPTTCTQNAKLCEISGFSGLHSADAAAVVETAEAVRLLLPRSITPLKRGVNERVRHAWTLRVFPNVRRLKPRNADFQPAVSQVFNLQGGGFYEAPADWKSAVQQAESLRYEDAVSPAPTGRRSP